MTDDTEIEDYDFDHDAKDSLVNGAVESGSNGWVGGWHARPVGDRVHVYRLVETVPVDEVKQNGAAIKLDSISDQIAELLKQELDDVPGGEPVESQSDDIGTLPQCRACGLTYARVQDRNRHEVEEHGEVLDELADGSDEQDRTVHSPVSGVGTERLYALLTAVDAAVYRSPDEWVPSSEIIPRCSMSRNSANHALSEASRDDSKLVERKRRTDGQGYLYRLTKKGEAWVNYAESKRDEAWREEHAADYSA